MNEKYSDLVTTEKEIIFQNYLNTMSALYTKKNHDYGDSVSKTFDEYGLTSFLVRMDDKMNRIKTLNKIKDAAVVGEKIEDTFLDLANYAILALTEIEFRKKQLLSEVSTTDDATIGIAFVKPKEKLELNYNLMNADSITEKITSVENERAE